MMTTTFTIPACSELKVDVIIAASSQSQLSESSDADQAAVAERSQDVKSYIFYESAELCTTQIN